MDLTRDIPGRGPRPGRPVCALGVRAGALLASGALVLSGCTARPSGQVIHTGAPRAADVALVRFTGCGDALRNLRAAASKAIGPAGYAARAGAAAGTGSGYQANADSQVPAGVAPGSGLGAAAPAAASPAGPAQVGGDVTAGSYSGTNTAEAGVDEPDLVKTDGRRIVTIVGGVLRVVDAQTRQLTGALDLAAEAGPSRPANMLLAGNHALVLLDQGYPVFGRGYPADGTVVPGSPPEVSPPAVEAPAPAGGTPAGGGPATPAPITGPRLLLIDLSTGTPRIVSEYTIDGALVDARQVGSVPRLHFPPAFAPGAGERTATSRSVINSAGLSDWLPRYALTAGNARRTGQVDCASVSHPAAAAYSGTSMLTILTFNLTSNTLGDGQPLTIVADGDTVYSNGSSLYIANDYQWHLPPGGAPLPAGAVPGAAQSSAMAPATATAVTSPALPRQYTGLYKFGISGQGRPVYQASGTVPGWLLGSPNTTQYALSEWNGALRVATTTQGSLAGWGGQPQQSAVYVLEQAGDRLTTVGKVGGLGRGEQIYAVRFAGPVGYVVTFRQADPLYTIDLSDPAQPRVAGELLLRGYSAYLDPVDASHLIGVGQDANALGQTRGTQISLFDVSDLTAPSRLAVFRLRFAHSEAEFDPHAFLYWPDSRLLVVPVQLPSAVTPAPGSEPMSQGGDVTLGSTGDSMLGSAGEAVVLHLGEESITRLGTITHPAVRGFPAGGQIRRSLVIGDTLWTLSDTGLKANELTTLAPLGWVPFG